MQTTQTFNQGYLTVSVTPESLIIGPHSYPWETIRAGGISVQEAGVKVGGVRFKRAYMQTGYYLHLAGGPQGGKPTELLVPLTSPNDAVVKEVQARLGNRWLGSDSYFAFRKRLGFSNRNVYLILAAIFVLVFGGVGGFVVYQLGKAKARRGNNPPAQMVPRNR